jgi:hypothetical protein
LKKRLSPTIAAAAARRLAGASKLDRNLHGAGEGRATRLIRVAHPLTFRSPVAGYAASRQPSSICPSVLNRGCSPSEAEGAEYG